MNIPACPKCRRNRAPHRPGTGVTGTTEQPIDLWHCGTCGNEWETDSTRDSHDMATERHLK